MALKTPIVRTPIERSSIACLLALAGALAAQTAACLASPGDSGGAGGPSSPAMLSTMRPAVTHGAGGAGDAASSLLLITLDTTRADHLGCYGAKGVSTPHIDALAARGVLFENAASPAPLTLPSHVTMLTGLPPRLHGVRDNILFRLSADHATLATILAGRGYTTAAVVGSSVLDGSTGVGRGFQTFDDRVRIRRQSQPGYEERSAAEVTSAAMALLPRLRAPFFLWVHYYDAHDPYTPPPPWSERFARTPYDGEIAFVDDRLGELLAATRRQTAGGALLVALAGDHGEELGEHGEQRHDVFLYQAALHVPLILQGPEVPAGRRIAARVGLVDLLPTILDLLRLPVPPNLPGRSLASAARGSAGPAPDESYEMESFFPGFAYGWSPLLALTSGSYKYVAAPRPELYDLHADPGELRNLLDTGTPAGKPSRSSAPSESDGALNKSDLRGEGRVSPPGSPRGGAEGSSPLPGPASIRPGSEPAIVPGSPPAKTLDIAERLAQELARRYATDPVARRFGIPAAAPRARQSPISEGAASTPGGGKTRPTPGPAAPSGNPPPPDAGEAERRERLASLGYIGGSLAPGATPAAGSRLDPKEGIAGLADLDRARALLLGGRAPEAVPLLEPLVSREPGNIPFLATLGAALVAAGQFDRAIEVHRRTVALNPDYDDTHYNLAGALRAKAASIDGAAPGLPGRAQNDPRAGAIRDEAAREYEQASGLNPRSSKIWLARAQLELERARPRDAGERLEAAERAGASDPDTLLLQGKISALLGNPAAARQAFERVLALDDRSADAHEALGRLDYASGDVRGAERHYARALALAPTAALARTLGAIRLHGLGDREGARRAFEQALALEPASRDSDEVRRTLEELSSP